MVCVRIKSTNKLNKNNFECEMRSHKLLSSLAIDSIAQDMEPINDRSWK
jgi:hypothetical protein